ncbi:uracil-DNA glycosylase family protein [Methylocystis rosea]|uniref:uracil-DNA glycosylase family protein n=1 Tax=Methylocystis rosea TaxID=173366 RepID=UPI0003601A84|nr:uracil-DNA glycosylase family protein [Methylocystis rosea]
MRRVSGRKLDEITACIRACRVCAETPEGVKLPHEPRPVLRVSPTARLLLASQAPGNLVNVTGVPFNDPSGDRLRDWMGVDRETFYDVSRIAIVPMGFCFPGYDAAGGDLPPRPECRPRWHDSLFAALPQIETVVAIGRYAQDYHFERLGHALPRSASVAEIVARWREFASARPLIFPLPHPSWRNIGWLKRNPWFEADVLPALRAEVARLVKT